jgi:tetratricopeptide (TPR) repeat protein
MTPQEVEKQLEELLKKLTLPKQITVQDIKDIIWNAADTKGSSRLFQALLEYATDEKTQAEVLQLSQNAWNYFPHRMLGGKAPYDLVLESQQTGTVTKPPPLPPQGKTFSDVFEDQNPQTVTFHRLSDDTWGWEFPKEYHALTEQLWELEDANPPAVALEKELYRMIKQMPELFDAVNRLAQHYGVKREFGLAKTIYEQTIITARSYIPKTFTPGTDRAIWAYMENRPFLRLLAGYAMLVEQLESVEQAIPLYEEIIAFNPNDNQGIRGLLATAYLKADKPEKVIELAAHYPEGGMAELNVGRLLAYLMRNREKEAKQLLTDMKSWHANIIEEILKPIHRKPLTMQEDRYRLGGQDEAYFYWQTQGILWEEIPGAKAFLEKNTKDIQKQMITISDKDILAIDFFTDFLTFLNHIEERPIKRTATGNLSLKDIDPLLQKLKTVQPILAHTKEMGWKLRMEDEIKPLHRIRVLNDIMHLIRKKHDKYLITKNGQAFLKTPSPVEQYTQIVEYYWQGVNWSHFSASGWVRDSKIKLCETLQKNQATIWRLLLKKGPAWIDYEEFCKELTDQLNLTTLLNPQYDSPDDISLYIHHILFSDNLLLFGCINVEEKQGKTRGDTITTRFRSTNLGLYMYQQFE